MKLEILRSEPGTKPQQTTVTAKLGELPANAFASRNDEQSNDGSSQQDMDALEGVQVTDIDAAARQQFDIPRNLQGALVVEVDQNSAAAEAGLQAGNIIVEINRHPVRNADQAVALSQQIKGEKVLLRVWSRTAGGPGGTHYLVVENSNKK